MYTGDKVLFLLFVRFFYFFLPERKQAANPTRCAGYNGDFPAHFVRTPSRVLTGPTEKFDLIKKKLNTKFGRTSSRILGLLIYNMLCETLVYLACFDI